RLKDLCEAMGLDTGGREKALLVERLLSGGEPPRVCRRLLCLRRGSHGTSGQVFTGGEGASGAAGADAAGRARLAMGGDQVDRGENGLHSGDAADVGPADRAE